MKWAMLPVGREQLELYSRCLDEIVSPVHRVRTVDQILRSLDWERFESHYCDQIGQPAIHPRVIASVILYGHIVRLRSSRGLEGALQERLDFMWLVEGRSIDHTTISEFRHRFGSQLSDIGAQMAVIAHQMGVTTLTKLAQDGTRLRASNANRATAAVEKLDELQAGFDPNYTPVATVDMESGMILDGDVRPSTDEEVWLIPSVDRIEAALAERGLNVHVESVSVDSRFIDGQKLKYAGTSDEPRRRHGKACLIERKRYEAPAAACIACALKSRCLQNEDSKNGRVLTIDEFEPERERLRDRMKEESNQAQHARRQAAGERPFAVIKHVLGICGFLLRGTERVRSEWNWITNSVNLMILTKLVHEGASAGTEMSSGDRGPPDLAGA